MKMEKIHILGNFAEEGECGTCSNMLLCGSISGVCEVSDYKDCMTTDKCFCGKYEKGKPQE